MTDDLIVGPDVELALFAFGIGIERRRESPFRRGHFALEPGNRLLRALPVECFAAALMGGREQLEKLRVVVEHLLEMRHEPAFVDRIAREAAAEMIVDAALADMVERNLDGGEIARLAGAQARSPQQFE